MIHIENTDDPRILVYKSLKSGKKTGLGDKFFIAEGIKVVRKLFESNLKVDSIFLLEEYLSEFQEKFPLKELSEDKVLTSSKEIMNSIVGFNMHAGILAIGIKPQKVELSKLTSPIMILNSIVDSENIGSLLRNAVAFDCNSIVYDNSTSDPYLRRAVRVSMGTVFDAKINKSQDLIETIATLKKLDYQIIAAEIDSASVDIEKFYPKPKVAIIFGSESKGIAEEVLKKCDLLVQIPINSCVKSINVAASSAVILHHINKVSSNS